MQAQTVTHLVRHDFRELTGIVKITARKRVEGEIGLEGPVKSHSVNNFCLKAIVAGYTRDRENPRAAGTRTAEIAITVIERDRIHTIEREQAARSRGAVAGNP